MAEGFETHQAIVQNAIKGQQVDLGRNVGELLGAKIGEKIEGMRSAINNQFFGKK